MHEPLLVSSVARDQARRATNPPPAQPGAVDGGLHRRVGERPGRPGTADTGRSARLEQQLTNVLVSFARTLSTDFSLQAILDHLVARVREVIPVRGVGVLLMSSGSEHHVVAASDELIRSVEALQVSLQEGPCLQAYQSREYVAVRDFATDTVFGRFSPAAARAGLGAVYAFPLRLNDHELGALDLYGTRPLDLSVSELGAAQVFADVAAAYLVNAQARQLAGDCARPTVLAAPVVAVP
jgi:transcriptional regulator with GAF, ATPase, and Fis domain